MRVASTRPSSLTEEQLLEDLRRRLAVRRDLDAGDLAVERKPLRQELLQLGPRVEREHRPGRRHPDALRGIRESDGQERDVVRSKSSARLLVQHSTASEAQDAAVLVERTVDGLRLERAEGFLTIVEEDVSHGLAGLGLDVGVCVAEADAEALGDQLPDRRLACTWWSDQDDDRCCQRITRLLRYASWLRRVSSRESPPNFSRDRSARTRATIASATTPAAGTAQTSLRWWCATASSPVDVSTVRSARGTVLIGFIAARTRSTSPDDIPPSVPPSRPLLRASPSAPGTISPMPSLPRRCAAAKPSPPSTPLMAWMPINAPASRESSRRSQCTWLPSPGGSP